MRSLSVRAHLVFVGMFSLCDDGGSVQQSTLQLALGLSGVDEIRELLESGLISDSGKGALRIENYLRRGGSAS